MPRARQKSTWPIFREIEIRERADFFLSSIECKQVCGAARSAASGASEAQQSAAASANRARAYKGTSLVSLVLGKAWEKLVSSLFLAIGRLAGIYAADCGRTTKALDRLKQVWNKHVSIMFQGS